VRDHCGYRHRNPHYAQSPFDYSRRRSRSVRCSYIDLTQLLPDSGPGIAVAILRAPMVDVRELIDSGGGAAPAMGYLANGERGSVPSCHFMVVRYRRGQCVFCVNGQLVGQFLVLPVLLP
jgi:hypothetical protein